MKQGKFKYEGLSVTLDGGVLNDALKELNRIVPAKSYLPVLVNHLHIEAEGKKVFLRATDLSQEQVMALPARVHTPGELVVPVKDFLDRAGKGESLHLRRKVQKWTDTKTTFSATGEAQEEKVKGESVFACADVLAPTGTVGFEVEVNTLMDDYPPRIGEGVKWAWNGILSEALVEALKGRISKYAASDEVRPILAGVTIWPDRPAKGKIQIVAADGFRMAVWDDKKPRGMIHPFHIARDTLGKLSKGAYTVYVPDEGTQARAEDGTIVRNSFSHVPVRLVRGATEFLFHQTSGTYPGYEQLIPAAKDVKTRVRLDLPGLMALLKKLPTREVKVMRFTFAPRRGEVQVKAGTGEGSVRMEATLPMSGKVGKGVDRTAMNPVLLMDALSFNGFKTVEVAFTSPAGPCVWTMEGDNLRSILMPMMVQW